MANRNKLIVNTIGMGLVAGMRSMMPVALLSHHFSNNPSRALKKSKLQFIQSPVTAGITKVLSGVELITDKLPNTPDRVSLPQVLARLGSGSFAGAVLFKAGKKDAVEGLLIGGAVALASTFAFYYLRRGVSNNTNIKDAITGGAEDALALATGYCVLEGCK